METSGWRLLHFAGGSGRERRTYPCSSFGDDPSRLLALRGGPLGRSGYGLLAGSGGLAAAQSRRTQQNGRNAPSGCRHVPETATLTLASGRVKGTGIILPVEKDNVSSTMC